MLTSADHEQKNIIWLTRTVSSRTNAKRSLIIQKIRKARLFKLADWAKLFNSQINSHLKVIMQQICEHMSADQCHLKTYNDCDSHMQCVMVGPVAGPFDFVSCSPWLQLAAHMWPAGRTDGRRCYAAAARTGWWEGTITCWILLIARNMKTKRKTRRNTKCLAIFCSVSSNDFEHAMGCSTSRPQGQV